MLLSANNFREFSEVKVLLLVNVLLPVLSKR